MPRVLKAALCALLFLLLPAEAEILRARVVGITDGDTLTVLDSAQVRYKIRLVGIDAPEKAQPFGKRSKQSLSDLADDRELTVTWLKHDRYGRLLGKLVSSDGQDINLEQVKRGMAWHYKDYQREQNPGDRVLYAKAEEGARNQRTGLWSTAQPVSPWAYRKQAKPRRSLISRQ